MDLRTNTYKSVNVFTDKVLLLRKHGNYGNGKK